MGFVAVVGLLAGVLVLWDVLVVTDEERLEVFVEHVTGPVSASRVASARARWVDLDRQPLEISALGRSLRYGAGDEEDLTERSHRALEPVFGDRLRVLTDAITVEGDDATVSLRVMSERRGLATLEWRLRRHGDEWLVERLAVRR